MKSHEQRSDSDDGQLITPRIVSGAIKSINLEAIYISECQAYITNAPNTTISISRVSRIWGSDEAWTTTMNTDSDDADVSFYRDRFSHNKVGSQRGTEQDWEWYLDFSGYLPPGTKFLRFECTTCSAGVSAGRR